MKLDRTIVTSESESSIHDRVAAYLENLGYQQVAQQPALLYQRGSVSGSLTSFSPKGWLAKASITFFPNPDQTTVATINLDINATGQLVTAKERSFWNSELDGLETAIRTGRVDVTATAEAAQASSSQNLKAAVVILALMVVLAIVARLLFDSRLAFYIGGALGLALGFVIAKKWLEF